MRTSSVPQPRAQHPTPTFPEVQVASWGTKWDAVGSLSQQALRLLQRLPGPHLRVDTLGTNTGATFQTCQALKSSLRTVQGVLLPCQREHLVSLFHRVTTKRWGLLWKLIISQFPKAELPAIAEQATAQTSGGGLASPRRGVPVLPQPSVPSVNKGQRLSL